MKKINLALEAQMREQSYTVQQLRRDLAVARQAQPVSAEASEL